MSMGRGNTMVEFFSADIVLRVWKSRKNKTQLKCPIGVERKDRPTCLKPPYLHCLLQYQTCQPLVGAICHV